MFGEVAGVGTDTGHNSDAGEGSWALGNDVSVQLSQVSASVVNLLPTECNYRLRLARSSSEYSRGKTTH